MNADFEECLRRKKVWEFSRGKSLAEKELKTAEKDLSDGREGIEREKYKWSTVQAYYSMFHSARALLYAKNYREKSHYCLIVALRSLYVDKKLLPNSLIESLQNGKSLRERADYYQQRRKAPVFRHGDIRREFFLFFVSQYAILYFGRRTFGVSLWSGDVGHHCEAGTPNTKALDISDVKGISWRIP